MPYQIDTQVHADHGVDLFIVPVAEVARILRDGTFRVEQRQFHIANVGHPARGPEALDEVETDPGHVRGDPDEGPVSEHTEPGARARGDQPIEEVTGLARERQAATQR